MKKSTKTAEELGRKNIPCPSLNMQSSFLHEIKTHNKQYYRDNDANQSTIKTHKIPTTDRPDSDSKLQQPNKPQNHCQHNCHKSQCSHKNTFLFFFRIFVNLKRGNNLSFSPIPFQTLQLKSPDVRSCNISTFNFSSERNDNYWRTIICFSPNTSFKSSSNL